MTSIPSNTGTVTTPQDAPGGASEPLTPLEDAANRLDAWAGCVRRLMAVAPTRAVMYETGVRGGHSTPPERQAIRGAALAVVDAWLARDRAALAAPSLIADAREVERLRAAIESRIAMARRELGKPSFDRTDIYLELRDIEAIIHGEPEVAEP